MSDGRQRKQRKPRRGSSAADGAAGDLTGTGSSLWPRSLRTPSLWLKPAGEQRAQPTCSANCCLRWSRHSLLPPSHPHKNIRSQHQISITKCAGESRQNVLENLVSTFPPYLLRWTSSFARDDDAQQERRNGFSAIATMLPLFSSLCVFFCSAAVRGARAPRGRRQAGLLFVFEFPS